MPLDPQAQKLIETLDALDLPVAGIAAPAELRRSLRERSAGLPREHVASVRDHRVPVQGGEIVVRVFTPRLTAQSVGTMAGSPGNRSTGSPLPVMVYFHGGGWVVGDVDTHEAICRTLANAASCVVASVDYRCAPEFRYPTAAEDAHAATCWIAEHAGELGVDARRLALCGDSAGGNLAAVVPLMARDRGGPRVALQVLVYPVTDCDLDTPSYRENATGYILTREGMCWYWDQYAPGLAERREPYASPLRASSLAALPPALVITAEYDPLRDDGELYARRLAEAGVPVTLSRYPGMVHSFFRLTNVMDAARAAVREVADALEKAWA
jgi:acetyl esterase/lipase